MKWDYVAYISISITDYLSAYQCSWWWTGHTTRHNYQRSYYINKYSVSRNLSNHNFDAIPFCRISVYKRLSVPSYLITLINFYKIIFFRFVVVSFYFNEIMISNVCHVFFVCKFDAFLLSSLSRPPSHQNVLTNFNQTSLVIWFDNSYWIHRIRLPFISM